MTKETLKDEIIKRCKKAGMKIDNLSDSLTGELVCLTDIIIDCYEEAKNGNGSSDS